MDHAFDFGALEIIGFYAVGMGIVAWDIIKTRREIAADKAKAADEAVKHAANALPVQNAGQSSPASEAPRSA